MAMKAYEKSLAVLRKVYGQSHPSVATALNNISAVYFGDGDLAQAETYLKQAIFDNLGHLSSTKGK